VQRLVADLPPVHLEAEVPPAGPDWTLRVEGMVRRPLELSLADLAGLAEEVAMDHHCVWGWSRRGCRWTGAPVGAVLDRGGAREDAAFVTVACRVPPYAACLAIADARAGVLAWALDGRPLAPANGAPLRFQNPPWLWGYKGVKWTGALRVGDRFEPGFWEARTGDPRGLVPDEVLAAFREPPGAP
jgi:DMSO/TMAO reductase YedYZ molybdopterin-dependent catalytic subunit